MMPKRGPKSIINLWKFGSCDFLFFANVLTLKSFLYMIRRPRVPLTNDKISMQFGCSKIYEKVIENVPTWFQNCYKMGTKIQTKPLNNRSEKTLFSDRFLATLVPVLLAKWSPTRRTSSRTPNKKGKLKGKRTSRKTTERATCKHARAAGEDPQPRADFR